MAQKYSSLPDDALITLLLTEGDRLSRETIDEIVTRGRAMIDPLTWLVMDARAWGAEPPAQWAPIHATFALGAISGEDALLGLLAAAEHADACECGQVTAALPAILGRFGASVRPYVSERLRDHGRRPRLRAIMAQCLAATTLRDPHGADAVCAELEAVSGETHDVALKSAVEQALAAIARINAGDDGPDRPPYDADWLARYPPEDMAHRVPEDAPVGDTDVELAEEEWHPDPVAQVIRRQPKIGRNASCPCGSGKKYKKCCLEIDTVFEPLGV